MSEPIYEAVKSPVYINKARSYTLLSLFTAIHILNTAIYTAFDILIKMARERRVYSYPFLVHARRVNAQNAIEQPQREESFQTTVYFSKKKEELELRSVA